MPAATRSRRGRARAPDASTAASTSDPADALVPLPASAASTTTTPPSVYETFAHTFLQSESLAADELGRDADGEEGDDHTAAARNRLLDPEHGIALQYAEACREQWAEASAKSSTGRIPAGGFDDMDQDVDAYGQDEDAEAGQWAYEYYAWMILHALSVERTQTREKMVRGEQAPAPSANPYHPALLRASDVLSQSPALRELNIVREWLHTLLDPYEALPLSSAAAAPTTGAAQRGFASQQRRDAGGNAADIVEVRKGYWTFTKNALRAAKRGGQIPPSNSTTAGASLGSGGGGAGGLTSGAGLGGGVGGLGGSSSSLFTGIRKSGVGIGGGAGAAMTAHKVLRTLDPDAPCRAGEGELANEDLAYERAFLRSLFVLARAGKLQDALDLCRQADRPWRAASLRGAIPYFDPRLLDGSVSSDSVAGLPQGPYGNRNRALWKATARKLASMKSLDPYERALYGALSGSLEPVLACSSSRWEEALWAYVNAKLEAGIESGLRKSLFAVQQQQQQQQQQRQGVEDRLRVKREHIEENDMLADGEDGAAQGYDQDAGIVGPGAAAGGNEARRARNTAAARLGLGVGNDLTLRSSEDETALETLSMADVFEQVEARVDRESNTATGENAFFAAQRAIILGDLRPLLVTFDAQMELYSETLPPRRYHRYVRFFAHVILYLRSLQSVWRQMPAAYGRSGFIDEYGHDVGMDEGAALGPLLLPEPMCDNIVREYIRVLQLTDQSDELVALYSSQLLARGAGVEQYAAYLLSLGSDTPMEARSRALSRAAEFGLSLGAVARRTVSLVFSDLLPRVLPTLDEAQAQLGSLGWKLGVAGALEQPVGISADEAELLHALEWLTFAEDTFGNAVLRCNQLTRCFLASGRLAAARQAVSRLPSDLIAHLSSLVVASEVGETDFDAQMIDEGMDQHAVAGKLHHVEQLECLSWGNLFDALDDYQQYLSIASARERSMSTASKKAEFAGSLQQSIDRAENTIKVVLEGDWLRFDLDDVSETYPVRFKEYKRIRQLFIPELVFGLHFMLFDSRDLVPDALARALVLPNLVADGTYALWEDFISRPEDSAGAEPEKAITGSTDSSADSRANRLPEYLEAVRQAELAALDSLGPDPFRAAILVGADTDGDLD